MNSQQSPRPTKPVEYKGEPLDPARGPGLGCFWFQMLLLAALIIITPLSATTWGWPTWVTTVLFVVMIVVLLISGQTMIFLLRLVAAGRSEGRRRPLASTTPTVGEIEDESPAEGMPADGTPADGTLADGTLAQGAPADRAPGDRATQAADEVPEPADPETATTAAPREPPATLGNDVPGMRQ